MIENKLLRGLLLSTTLALLVALSLPMIALADKGNPPSGPGTDAVGHVTIAGDPLTIHVAADMSIQVFYAGEPDGQVYPPEYNEADSGGFAWYPPAPATTVIGPDFLNHDWSAGNVVIPWQSAGPQALTGSGTAADPWWVRTDVTVQRVLDVTQWVRYIDGDDCFRVSYIVSDPATMGANPITFFHAADLYVDGDDEGFGYHNAASGAVGAWNRHRTFLEYFVPVTEMGLPPATHYQEAGFQRIWDNIGDLTGPGPGFANTVRSSSFHDSGCGLQWDLTFPGVQPPGNFVELALDWCFLEVEEPPPPTEDFVPEPGSVLLLVSGLAGLAGYAGLRARKR
jgi:hypothetical protein